MRIDSHDRFDDAADFDPATGRVEELSRQDRSAMSSQCPSGHYSRLSGTLTVFYRVDGALWLRVGNEARNVDDPSCEVRWHHEDGSSTLEVVSEGDVVTSVKYRPEPGGGPTDPTPFAEREHFDFGLFVTNVLSDEGRRARIYATPKPPVRGSSPASGSG